MADLDDVDREILSMLMTDARQSYRDIAKAVSRSAPTVSNRVDRLRELGIIRRFTVDIDRSLIAGSDACFVRLDTRPMSIEAVIEELSANEHVEHVFQTVDGVIFAVIVLENQRLNSLLTALVDEHSIVDYSVDSLLTAEWEPQLESLGEFNITCTVCGNTVSKEGESVKLGDDDRHLVCCTSCASEITDRYEEFKENAASDS